MLGYKEIKQKDWIKVKTWSKILKRWSLKAKINAGRKRSEMANISNEHQSKKKEVKRMMCNDEKKFIEQLTDKAQEAANIGNTKELYENMKFFITK
jgi:hypothetical protein